MKGTEKVYIIHDNRILVKWGFYQHVGRLYAKKNSNYYAFQNEGDINYHGYRADDLGEEIKNCLDKEFG